MKRALKQVTRWSITLLTAGGLSACADQSKVEFWVSVAQPSEPAFQATVEAYNRRNPTSPVTLRNLQRQEFRQAFDARLAKGDPPNLVMLTQQQATMLPEGTFTPWISKLSPAVVSLVPPSLYGHPQGHGEALGMPLLVYSYVSMVNGALIDKGGVGLVPGSIGQVAQAAKTFKAKTGADLWLPPFGDPDYVLGLMDLQQVPLLDAQKRPLFANTEGRAAFRWWAQQFKEGNFPLSCLTMKMTDGIRLMETGKVAMATCLPADVALFQDSPTLAKAKLGANRDISAASGISRAVVLALFQPKQAKLTMGAQNFVKYLLEKDAQKQLSNAVNAIPAIPSSIDPIDPGNPIGGRHLVRFNQIAIDYLKDATTTYGSLSEREYLAEVLRTAFVQVCRDGADAEAALEQAAQAYRKRFGIK